jgi:hypothetical protein
LYFFNISNAGLVLGPSNIEISNRVLADLVAFRTFTKVSQRGAYAIIIEDKKGNIWTTGSNGSAGQFLKDSSGRSVWALSRYDHKSLYNKKPTVTEIMSGPPAFLGLLEANDGSIWFGPYNGVYRYDGKTITDFKSKEGQK